MTYQVSNRHSQTLLQWRKLGKAKNFLRIHSNLQGFVTRRKGIFVIYLSVQTH